MAGIYGHRWTSAYGDDSRSVGGKEWALTLAGFTREQIDAGLDACRNSVDEWPPSAGAFKAKCLGIPSIAQVRIDLVNRTLGFTRLVWTYLDAYRLARSDQRDAERLFQQAYEVAAEARMQGVEFPEALAAIEHEAEPFQAADPEIAYAAIAECRAALAGEGAP